MSFTKDKMQKMGIHEIYMPFNDYPNYEVSNYGRVRNRKTSRILKPKIRNGYECFSLCDGINKPKNILTHRLVLLAFEGKSKDENQKCVDHIDNNPLNNCLFNLRWVTYQQNQFNKSMQKNNTSGIRGISFNKQKGKYESYIRTKKNKLHLGVFDSLEDAKLARQNKARELFGQYLNQCEL
jgi:hypothetical protein